MELNAMSNFYCTIYEHLGIKRPISSKYILKTLTIYLLLVFFENSSFQQEISGPVLNKK